jgi:hypothetical protein
MPSHVFSQAMAIGQGQSGGKPPHSKITCGGAGQENTPFVPHGVPTYRIGRLMVNARRKCTAGGPSFGPRDPGFQDL